MTWDVAAVVGPAGWATAEELTARVDRGTQRSWVTAGRLVRLRPGVYATPQAVGDWRTRVRAALAGRDAVASHGTALALWELVAPPPVRCASASSPAAAGAAPLVWCCRAADLAFQLARRPRLPGRADLARLVRLLEQGCRSELEIRGCWQVLAGPGMPRFTQQHPVTVAGRRFLLDGASEEVLLAVEMDGAAFHGSPRQREADIARDALLATLGWQTLRFSYVRLTTAAEACRDTIRATHQARRRLLGGHGVR